ncbi:MAG: DUF4177 domain-containing protein [Geobacteraceae bacterium]|nr:DUF4177 domain-containing protein [Geobacteraceae bacterium]
MSWEYKLVFIGSAAVDEELFEESLHASLHTLNSLGSEGWELIGFLPHLTPAGLQKYHAVFKREKKG